MCTWPPSLGIHSKEGERRDRRAFSGGRDDWIMVQKKMENGKEKRK